MNFWILALSVVSTALVAAVVTLAIRRLENASRDRKLKESGASELDSLHLRLRHLIQTEDRIGISLTISAAVCTVILSYLVATQLLGNLVRKLVQVLTFR